MTRELQELKVTVPQNTSGIATHVSIIEQTPQSLTKVFQSPKSSPFLASTFVNSSLSSNSSSAVFSTTKLLRTSITEPLLLLTRIENPHPQAAPDFQFDEPSTTTSQPSQPMLLPPHSFSSHSQDQNRAPVLVPVPPLQGLNNSFPATLVVDHNGYAVTTSKGEHTLLAPDDFVQSVANLENKKIEAPVLFRGKTMAYHQVDEFDPMVEEQDVADIVENVDEEYNDRDGANFEWDEYDLLTKVNDTSAALARQGKDIQGVPWDRLNITREKYRLTRLEQYKNYENFPPLNERVDKECKQGENSGRYFEFFYNSRLVHPTILHFQLRNLVCAPSKPEVYLMSNYSVQHWSSLPQNLSEVINLAEQVAASEKHPGSLLEGFSQAHIRTLAVKHNFLVAGGFQGELAYKRLDKFGLSFCTRTTYDKKAITNAVELFNSWSGRIHFVASNIDWGVREYEREKFQLLNHFRFPWAVNHTSVSPNRKLITVVGDDQEGLLADAQTGRNVATVMGTEGYATPEYISTGYLDVKSDVYSFSVARVEMRGNEWSSDKCRRQWDPGKY